MDEPKIGFVCGAAFVEVFMRAIIDVVVKAKESFYDACVLNASIATTGPQGGDAGHGGFAQVTIQIEGEPIQVSQFDDDTVVLRVQGDAEMRTLAKALLWAGKQLEASNPSDDEKRTA